MTKEQQLLAKAADILEERGHTKYILEDHSGGVCAIGALNIAHHGCSRHRGGDGVYSAVKLVETALGLRPDRWSRLGPLAEWNNANCRTGAEVIDAFRQCAGVPNLVLGNAHDRELDA